MNNPSGGTPSPFVARTRAPFPGQSGAVPATPLTTTPAVPTAPTAVVPPPTAKKQVSYPLIFALVLIVGGGAAAAFIFLGGKGAAPAVPVAAPAPVVPDLAEPAVAQVPVAAPVLRDSKKDYDFLSKRLSSLTLASSERAEVAAATLQASGGAYADAVARIGPLVAKQVTELYVKKAVALSAVNLEDHTISPATQKLLLASSRADSATKNAIWAEAVSARDEALALVPEAEGEIAGRLSLVAKEALERNDLDLATYFYERALRLDSKNQSARAHLFLYKFKPGQSMRATNGMEFVYVPPGEFMRGSRSAEPGRSADEEQALVRFNAGIFMALTEVTQRQWDQVMGPGSAARTILAARAKGDTIGPDLPMHSVRWDEVKAFCDKLSAMETRPYRLPTEAEWEYACRAGAQTAFNTGSDGLSARDANIDDGSAASTGALVPVGIRGQPNAWGLRDMHGNVWEWCADWSAPYPAGDLVDPTGPAENEIGSVDLAMKVVRGGGWNSPASDARSANRWEYSPAVTTPYIGFRIVLEPDLSSR